MAAVNAEIAEVESAISELGIRQRVGIGGAGSDSLEAALFVVELVTLLNDLGALRAAAQKLGSIIAMLRSTQHTTWRLSQEALIIECCNKVRELQRDEYDVDVRAIRVTSVLKRESDESPVPEGSHLVVIPSRKYDRTYVFIGDGLEDARLMCIVEGRPRET